MDPTELFVSLLVNMSWNLASASFPASSASVQYWDVAASISSEASWMIRPSASQLVRMLIPAPQSLTAPSFCTDVIFATSPLLSLHINWPSSLALPYSFLYFQLCVLHPSLGMDWVIFGRGPSPAGAVSPFPGFILNLWIVICISVNIPESSQLMAKQ